MAKFIFGSIKKIFALNFCGVREYIFAILGTLLIVLGPELLFSSSTEAVDDVPESLRQIHDIMSGPQDALFFWVLILVSLFGPILEELLFRGALWSVIEKVINKHYAFFITSVLFAAAHGTPEHIVAVFPIGVWIGWLRFRSESIWPPILAHIINNSIVSLFIVMQW